MNKKEKVHVFMFILSVTVFLLFPFSDRIDAQSGGDTDDCECELSVSAPNEQVQVGETFQVVFEIEKEGCKNESASTETCNVVVSSPNFGGNVRSQRTFRISGGQGGGITRVTPQEEGNLSIDVDASECGCDSQSVTVNVTSELTTTQKVLYGFDSALAIAPIAAGASKAGRAIKSARQTAKGISGASRTSALKKGRRVAREVSEAALKAKAGVDTVRVPAKSLAEGDSLIETGVDFAGEITGISSANKLGENLAAELEDQGFLD